MSFDIFFSVIIIVLDIKHCCKFKILRINLVNHVHGVINSITRK